MTLLVVHYGIYASGLHSTGFFSLWIFDGKGTKKNQSVEGNQTSTVAKRNTRRWQITHFSCFKYKTPMKQSFLPMFKILDIVRIDINCITFFLFLSFFFFFWQIFGGKLWPKKGGQVSDWWVCYFFFFFFFFARWWTHFQKKTKQILIYWILP